jgi:uncharacterized protein (TIGR02596 family)
MKPPGKALGLDARTQKRGEGGFTLIELLVGLAVIIALMALVVPAVGPIFRSSGLNKSGALVMDELNLARQLAMTKNRDVEVRFYKLRSSAGGEETYFRAIQLWDPEKDEAVQKVKYLPEPVIISEDPALSPLLDHSNPGRSGLRQGTADLPSEENAEYVSFIFRATGGTNLAPVDPSDGLWFLTLLLRNDPVEEASGIPANYFTAQVEPVTGRVRSHRP